MASLLAISTKDAPDPVGSYSQGIKAGDFIFVSGQIPLNPRSGEIVKGELEVQIKQVLENVKAILEAGGSSLKKVVKMSVFLNDLEDAPKVNTIFEKYFSKERPAREMMEVSRLPKEALLEISAIALS